MALAVQVGITDGALMRLVDQMVRVGLIRREPDPTDGRGVVVVVTARGHGELRRALPHYHDAIRQTGLGTLTASEGRTLQRVLRMVGGK